jgi:WD40 repeat protein
VPALDSAGMKECLLFSADGKHCVWWSNRGKARFFDLADNFASQVVAAYDADLNWRPAYLAPDGRNMVVLVWKGLLGCEPPPSDPCLRLFSVPDGRLQLKLGLACPPLCGAYAPNSAEFYSGGLDGRIHRWDLERGTSTGEVTR